MSWDSFPVTLMKDRDGFLYLEHAVLHVCDSSLEVKRSDGVRAQLPVATLGTVYIGPGCSVTTDAIDLLTEMGAGMVWCRGDGIRMVGAATPVARSCRTAMEQARRWANPIEHMTVIRRMYEMRFGDGFGESFDLAVDDEKDPLRVLRGREGVRVKESYRRLAQEYGVPWRKRTSKLPHEDCDRINRALNTAHHILDGVAHTIIVGTGRIPQLGFIHTESSVSLVLDISDLYKTSIADPVAFRVCGDSEMRDEIVEVCVREELRNEISAQRLHERVVDDLRELLGGPDEDFVSPTAYWSPMLPRARG